MGLAQMLGRFAGDTLGVGGCVGSGVEGAADGSTGALAMAGSWDVGLAAGALGASGASRLR